jgi:hypothetical protein
MPLMRAKLGDRVFLRLCFYWLGTSCTDSFVPTLVAGFASGWGFFHHLLCGLRGGSGNGGFVSLCQFIVIVHAWDCDAHFAAGKFQTIFFERLINPVVDFLAQRELSSRLGHKLAADHDPNVVKFKNALALEGLQESAVS